MRSICRLVLLVLCAAFTTPTLAATQRGAFERAPFYDGKVPSELGSVGYAGVTFRDQSGSLDPTPARSPALAALVDSLNAALDDLALSREDLSRLPVALPADDGPEISFGCRRGGVDDDGFPRSADEIDPREPRRMAFEVDGPGKRWREAVAPHGAMLVVELRFGEYWVRQKDSKGGKQIELGTGRAAPVAWLTSLDDPVQVLQLTAALVSREGKVLRVGAEGLTARRTSFKASVAGLQEVLTEEELAAIAAVPADGQLPAWRTALASLVTQMLVPGNAPR